MPLTTSFTLCPQTMDVKRIVFHFSYFGSALNQDSKVTAADWGRSQNQSFETASVMYLARTTEIFLAWVGVISPEV